MQGIFASDALTGLPPRAACLELLYRVLGSSGETAVIFIDFDGFKFINDSFGHATGDEFLKAAAGRLAAALGPETFLARLGGDEFAVVLTAADAHGPALAIADQVIAAMQRPVRCEGRDLIAGASVGIAIGMGGKTAPSELLRQADLAMYEAKRLGGGHAVMFEEHLARACARKLALLTQIRQSLCGPMALRYEAVTQAATGHITAARAALDWPGRADNLLAFAAGQGLGKELLLRALESACADHAHWQGLRLAVPAAVQQLLDPGFEEALETLLTRCAVEPASIEFQFNAAQLPALHKRPALRMLARLARLGIGFSLSGFGRGACDISLLGSGLFSRLLIDESLTRSLPGDQRTQHLVHGIAAIARAHAITTGAEGAAGEPEQLRLLRLAGISEFMRPGHSFSAPQMGRIRTGAVMPAALHA